MGRKRTRSGWVTPLLFSSDLTNWWISLCKDFGESFLELVAIGQMWNNNNLNKDIGESSIYRKKCHVFFANVKLKTTFSTFSTTKGMFIISFLRSSIARCHDSSSPFGCSCTIALHCGTCSDLCRWCRLGRMGDQWAVVAHWTNLSGWGPDCCYHTVAAVLRLLSPVNKIIILAQNGGDSLNQLLNRDNRRCIIYEICLHLTGDHPPSSCIIFIPLIIILAIGIRSGLDFDYCFGYWYFGHRHAFVHRCAMFKR